MKRPCFFRLCSVLAASCAAVSPLVADYETDFTAKADVIIDWVADVYAPPSGSSPYDGSDIPDPEKYTGPKMLARFLKYGVADPSGLALGASPSHQTNANNWLEQGIIQSSGSPNLFHFRFLGLAQVLAVFGTAPGATGVFDNPVIGGSPTPRTYADAYIEAVMTRTDNFSAFTGEGTENHINMSRPMGWIFARLAQGSAYYTARRADNPAGYPDPAVKEAEMRDYLKDWARQLYLAGSAEYDSSVYGAFNTAPWFSLYEVTAPGAALDDTELHAVARAVLDWYAGAMALKYRYGVFSGASVRGEPKVDRYDRDDESDFLTWLWFGDPLDVPTELSNNTPRVDNQPPQAIYAAISGYRPPAAAVALAEKAGMQGAEYRNGRPNYLMGKPGEALEQHFIGSSYTLGSAQFPYGGWGSSVFRVNQWKLMADVGTYTPAAVTGNNGLRTFGDRWMFHNAWMQVVQDRNVIVQLNRVPANAQTLYNNAMDLIRDVWVEDWYADFIQRYPSPDLGGFQGDQTNGGQPTPVKAEDNGTPANARTSFVYFDRTPTSVAVSGSVRFAQFGDTFIAVRALDGSTPGYSSSSRYFNDFTDYGLLGGFIVEAGSASDANYTTFAEFQAYYLANTALSTAGLTATYTAMDGRVIEATYATTGTYTEPEYDWAYGVTEPVSRMFLTSYNTGVSPPESWTLPASPGGDGSGRVASWTVDRDGAGPLAAESYDVNTVWPVFDGPNFKVTNRVLHLWDGSELYTVDYSGADPVTTQGPIPVPLSAISVVGGDAIVDWPTQVGLTYRLYRSGGITAPYPGGWSLEDTVVGDGTTEQFNGGPVTSPDTAFFRIEVSFE